MSRKSKRSSNGRKAVRRVKKSIPRWPTFAATTRIRSSDAISKNHAMVVIEDLQVANMSKSAKGSLNSPGRNVKAKSGLNRSILDQGWHELRRQLEYKQFWRGGDIVAVPPHNTSCRCSSCGHIAKENRTTQSNFLCVACGYMANADLNAAQNILATGHAVLACGETVQ